jgi:hypothetical protein
VEEYVIQEGEVRMRIILYAAKFVT